MITNKAFSTISYNTDSFLKIRLDELLQSNDIEFYCFINHLPEKDEQKAHKHVYIVPSKKIDTSNFLTFFRELEENNTKPLNCIMFKHSKWADWYLYALHDEKYLASKGQMREYHYTRNEIVCSDSDYMNELIHTIDYNKLFGRIDVVSAGVEKGVSFVHMVRQGLIPIQLINQYSKAYDILYYKTQHPEEVYRNDRQTHTPNVNYESGEVL